MTEQRGDLSLLITDTPSTLKRQTSRMEERKVTGTDPKRSRNAHLGWLTVYYRDVLIEVAKPSNGPVVEELRNRIQEQWRSYEQSHVQYLEGEQLSEKKFKKLEQEHSQHQETMYSQLRVLEAYLVHEERVEASRNHTPANSQKDSPQRSPKQNPQVAASTANLSKARTDERATPRKSSYHAQDPKALLEQRADTTELGRVVAEMMQINVDSGKSPGRPAEPKHRSTPYTGNLPQTLPRRQRQVQEEYQLSLTYPPGDSIRYRPQSSDTEYQE